MWPSFVSCAIMEGRGKRVSVLLTAKISVISDL